MANLHISIKHENVVEVIIQKSRFITHIAPIKSETAARNYIKQIKTEHFDASHNCSAYITGEHGEIHKSNDDGEPTGTAGIPMLEVLKKRNVRDVAVIVTRYFGGIKLGGGGLIRAYSHCVATVLNTCSFVKKIPCFLLKLQLDYSDHGRIEHHLKSFPIRVHTLQFQENVIVSLSVPSDNFTVFKNKIFQITNGRVNITKDSQHYEYVDIISEQ